MLVKGAPGRYIKAQTVSIFLRMYFLHALQKFLFNDNATDLQEHSYFAVGDIENMSPIFNTIGILQHSIYVFNVLV